MAFLPLADTTRNDLQELLRDVPGPCQRGVKRSREDVASDRDIGIPQASLQKKRRLMGKQKTTLQFTTPLGSLCAPQAKHVASQGPQDDFDLPLSAMAGPPQEPLDPPEPSDEQLQVGPQT